MTRRAVPVLFLLLLGHALPAEGSLVAELAIEGKLAISIVDAVRIERRLGQLMMVNVDGFGVSGPLAVARGYRDLVEELQIGAVIPHYGRCDPAVIRATNDALRRLTVEPLIVASDIVTLCAPSGARASFGDGYVGGLIGKHRGLDDRAFGRLAELNAFVCSALGMNCALWPTVDASTRDERTAARARVVLDALARHGMLATLKHWPFVPQGVDLHKESVDSAVPLAEVERLGSIFRELADRGDLLMTTHVYDSLVDDGVVTLSPRWLEILDRSIGFRGPVVSDGLFMLRSHRARAAAGEAVPGLGRSGDDEIAGWAVRAILAGHDLIIVEGSAATSRHVFRRLLEVSCRDDELGARLRGRVLEAHAAVVGLKRRRAAELRGTVDAPAALLESAIALVSRGAAGLADDAAWGRLERDIASVSGKEGKQ